MSDSKSCNDRPRTTLQRWRTFAIWIGVFYLVGRVPEPWGIVAPLSIAIVFSVAVAIVTFIRTRWLFRVASDLLFAALLAGFAGSTLKESDVYGQFGATLLVSVLLLLFILGAPILERRYYPKQAHAFMEASRAAGLWGVFLMRHIPRLHGGRSISQFREGQGTGES